ncbi:MAG: MFS transporter [Acidobacteriota bacterium]
MVFAVLALSYMLVTFHRLCPAVVAVDMMRDLQAGGTLIGMLSGAFFYSYAFMQLPAGLLADFWGARRTTSLFYLFASLGALGMGLAPDSAWATFGRVLVGLGMSMIWVCSLKTLAEWYTPDRFATMTGLLVAVGGAGSLLASAPLAWAVQHIGWRAAFVALSFLSLGLSGVLWTVVRDTPALAGFKGPEFPHGLPPGSQALMPGVRAVVSNRWAWLVAAWLMLDNGVFFSLAGLWAGPYLSQVHGFTATQAGFVLAMFSVGVISGGAFLSHLSNSLLKSRKMTLALSAAALCGLTGILSWRAGDLSGAELYGVFYLIGIFGGATPAIAFTTGKELFPISLAGTALGILNIFPFAGGALFQPLLGLILEHHGRDAGGSFTVEGYRAAFLALCLASAMLLAVCLTIKETLRPGRDPRTANRPAR